MSRQSGVLTLYSIFDEMDPLAIEYSNIDKVSSLKAAICKKKHYNVDDLVLFCNSNFLEDDRFLFELGSEDEYEIRYCRFMRYC